MMLDHLAWRRQSLLALRMSIKAYFIVTSQQFLDHMATFSNITPTSLLQLAGQDWFIVGTLVGGCTFIEKRLVLLQYPENSSIVNLTQFEIL